MHGTVVCQECTVADDVSSRAEDQGLYYVGGKEANCLHMEVGGIFLHSGGGDFTKIILMRATVVRPKSGGNK